MLLTKNERGGGLKWPFLSVGLGGFGGLGCKPWGQSADGDNSVELSVGVEKVQTKNETATDFRL